MAPQKICEMTRHVVIEKEFHAPDFSVCGKARASISDR